MDDNKLLELLRELEWSAVYGGVPNSCPDCGQEQGHPDYCRMNAAIAFVQARCDKQAAWNLLAADLGRGQPVVMRDLPVYGIWAGSGWLMTAEGPMFQSHSRNGIQAYLSQKHFVGGRTDLSVREIGPDGLPVPEPPENE